VSARAAPRRAIRLAVLLAAGLVPVLAAAGLGDTPPPISVSIDGRRAFVAAGTDLRAAVRTFGLRPQPGRLLDLGGRVLDEAADPGAILVDGRPARPATVLSDGARIAVVDGVDRTETTRRVRTELPGRRPGDPQYSLATAPIVRIETVGRVSGIVVSTDFRAVGPARRPPEVALTFDDGPWPRTTRRILSILDRMRARATFFVVGYLAERYPRLIRAERRAGMAIGSHSWDHPEPFDRLGPRRMLEEMRRVNGMLWRRHRIRVALFRPPGGGDSTAVVTAAERLGMRVVDWNVDPRDWSAAATPRSIAHDVLSNVERGSIVELHDGGGDRSATVEALPDIIRGIRRKGLKLVVLR
jgi:peptidoglycan/xylan/chitin deacetylase (PgdA/CDA1 family)